MTISKERLNQTREEQARIELGHTAVSRRLAMVLTYSFLALIVAAPVVQVTAELVRGEPVQALEVFTRPPTLPNLKQFETSLERESVIVDVVLPWVQEHVLTPTGVGNSEAYIGRDGWLFYKPGVDFLSQRGFLDEDVLLAKRRSGDASEEAIQPDPVLAIVDFRDQLRERGVELVVMPTPVKPQVYPEKISSRYTPTDAPLHNVSYRAFLARLADAEVNVFDPTPHLVNAKLRANAPALYLRTDTHWTPEGMLVAAEALATGIAERFELPAVSERPAYRRTTAPVTSPGDILKMLKMRDGQRLYEHQTVTIQRVMLPPGKERELAWTTVTGVVKEVAPLPGRTGGPYPNLRVGIHLGDVTSDDRPVPTEGGEVYLYVQGVRDQEPTWVAKTEVGDRITLSVTPWDDADDIFGAMEAVDVVHGDFLFLPTYWGATAQEVAAMKREPVWRTDPASPVLFLGDSYANIYSGESLDWGTSAGLVENLSAEMGRGLDRIIRDGNGAFATRQALAEALAADPTRLDGKRLVVWQFASRELAAGNWKLIELPPADTR